MSEPRLASVVLGAPDPQRLGAFYREFLGWLVVDDEPDWVKLKHPGGGTGIAIQVETQYVRPVWPGNGSDRQLQAHLDIGVPDLAAGVARAVALGAVLADHQPQHDIAVMLDPDGHPFCLFADIPTGSGEMDA